MITTKWTTISGGNIIFKGKQHIIQDLLLTKTQSLEWYDVIVWSRKVKFKKKHAKSKFATVHIYGYQGSLSG